MRARSILLVPLLLAGVPALAADRVEVTRFYTPETLARLGAGPVQVVAAPGIDGASLETRAWLDAVARELAARGFVPAQGEATPRIAEVRLTRDAVAVVRERSPISVGVGGSVGGGGGYYGRHRGGLGVGLGGGRPRDLVESELSVTIRDRATGLALWEGRSSTRTAAGSRHAEPARLAARLAHALFAGFPGRSGETIQAR
jgi:hypothetical protein